MLRAIRWLVVALATGACGSADQPLLMPPTELPPSLGEPASSPTGALSLQTRPFSPSVQATIAIRNASIELVVLWRGAPGWFLGSSTRGDGGGSPTGFNASWSNSTARVEVSYDYLRRSAIVNGANVVLPAGANVILVDGVDGAVSTVAGVSAVEPAIAGNPTLAELFGGSAALVSFLRCDAAHPNPSTNEWLLSFMCADLPH